jgi:hypothetical protein
MPRYHSKYTERQNSDIRFAVLFALENMAKNNGIDIKTMQTTPPYSLDLNGITSQKISHEIKKLIDSGMVVKGVVKGKPVRYMLRSTYESLVENRQILPQEFGYGDYRDEVAPQNENDDNYNEEEVCNRIMRYSAPKVKEMW